MMNEQLEKSNGRSPLNESQRDKYRRRWKGEAFVFVQWDSLDRMNTEKILFAAR